MKVSLQQQAVQQMVQVALKDPLNPDVPALLNEVISEYLDKGFYVSAIAAPLDAACEVLPLEVSSICRATILARTEWDQEFDTDSMPKAWEQTSVNLAASLAGQGSSSIPILEATSELHDGGRFALAGALNPAFESLPVNAWSWHPSISSPPLQGLLMLREDCSGEDVRSAGEPFISGAESQVWAVAALQGPTALVPWPEWRAVLSWISSEEPVGSLAYWSWLLRHIDAGDLDEAIGSEGNWWDLEVWQELVIDRLGYLLASSAENNGTNQDEVARTKLILQESSWPPARLLDK